MQRIPCKEYNAYNTVHRQQCISCNAYRYQIIEILSILSFGGKIQFLTEDKVSILDYKQSDHTLLYLKI